MPQALYTRFGNAIIRAALGAALTGARPVAEIMFTDLLAQAMDRITNELAKAGISPADRPNSYLW